jgi:hypothetical protein
MDKKREGKSVICFGCLYKLHILSKLTIGNFLEAVKYKIIDLNHSQLIKGILKKRTLMY